MFFLLILRFIKLKLGCVELFISLKDFKASFSFLNTVSTKNLKLRLKKRKRLNRYDKFNSTFYSKDQKGYFKIFSKRKNYMIIDSNLPINVNKKIIINKILDLIN